MLRRTGLSRTLRALHYCLIVLAALAAASVTSKLIGIEDEPKTASLPGATDEAASSPKSKRTPDDTIILKRNLFGAGDVDVAAEDAPAADPADLRLRGIATSEGASFAVFENTTSGEQNVFGVGEKVFDGPRLVSVDAGGADVLLRGKKRRYEIVDEDVAVPVADTNSKGRGAGKSAGPEKGSKKEGATSGVRKTGEGAWLVERREVEHAVANLNEVITQARAVPVLADGRGAGFKLFNIRRGSIFEKIGLVDGDIVQRINDTELSDPSKAVGLLEDIQSLGQIRVRVVHAGKPKTYTYTIR